MTLTIAVPKGRILKELRPLLEWVDILPEAAFDDQNSRQLEFATNHPDIRIIRVRSFDAATFVAFGAAQIGVAGSDVMLEFDYPDMYAPLDLGIGKCRLSIAGKQAMQGSDDWKRESHVRIATKYPGLTQEYFAKQGIQAECIKLNGAMELAPLLGMCDLIVDLVDTGNTLKANGLVELEVIAEISSRLIVNRTAFKTQNAMVQDWINRFTEVVNATT